MNFYHSITMNEVKLLNEVKKMELILEIDIISMQKIALVMYQEKTK